MTRTGGIGTVGRKAVLLLMTAALLLAWACAPQTMSVPAGNAGGALAPGLAVRYLTDLKIRHIDEMPFGPGAFSAGEAGPPVASINHRFENGPVFDSGETRLVGVILYGYLNLDRPGDWAFKAMSNDGVRVFVDGRQVLDDPSVHGDQWSLPGTVTVTDPGLKSLVVYYYQRKGTARLELHWKAPGAADFTPIPPEVYSHLEP